MALDPTSLVELGNLAHPILSAPFAFCTPVRVEPGTHLENEVLMASFRQTCPSCEDPVLIKDLLLVGKKVDCPKCKYKFIVEPPEGEAPANAKKPPKGKAPKSKKGRNQDADDEDEDDDEESDGPSKSSKKKNMVPIFVIAGVLLAGLLGGGGFLVLSGGDEDGGKPKPMAQKVPNNEGNNADNKGDPGVGPMGDPVVPPVVAQAKPPAQGFGNYSYPNLETPDLSNLIPPETDFLARINLHKVLNSNLGKAFFETPGAFNKVAFSKSMGFEVDQVHQLIVANNVKPQNPWTLVFLRTTSPIDPEAVIRVLGGRKEPIKIGQGNFDLIAFQKRVDSFSSTLIHMGKLLVNRPVLDTTSPEMALLFLDPSTILFCDSKTQLADYATKEFQPCLERIPKILPPPRAEPKVEKPPEDGAPMGPPGFPMGGTGGPPGFPMGGTGGPPGFPMGGPMGLPGAPMGLGGPAAPASGALGDPTAVVSPRSVLVPDVNHVRHFFSLSKSVQLLLDSVEGNNDETALITFAGNASLLTNSQSPLSGYLKSGVTKSIEGLKSGLGTAAANLLWKGLELGSAGYQFAVTIREFEPRHLYLDLGIRPDNPDSLDEVDPILISFLNLCPKVFKDQFGLDVATPSITTLHTTQGNPNSAPGAVAGGPVGGFGPAGLGGPGGAPGGMAGKGGGGPNLGAPPGGYGAPMGGMPGGMAMPGMPGMPGGAGGGFQGGGPGGATSPGASSSFLAYNGQKEFALVQTFVPFAEKSTNFNTVSAVLGQWTVRTCSQIEGFNHFNGIHDLAMGLKNYASRAQALPRGTVGTKTNRAVFDLTPDLRASWLAELTPNLFTTVNTPFPYSLDLPWSSEKNLGTAGLVIPSFVDTTRPGSSSLLQLSRINSLVAATSFVGVGGIGSKAATLQGRTPEEVRRLGAFGYDRITRLIDITDEKASTILVLEVPPSRQAPWIAGGGATIRTVSEQGNPLTPFLLEKVQDPITKKETNGTFAIMGDFKVRFIRGDINPETFRAMCTIAGGEKITNLDAFAPVFVDPAAVMEAPIPVVDGTIR